MIESWLGYSIIKLDRWTSIFSLCIRKVSDTDPESVTKSYHQKKKKKGNIVA